MEAYPPKAERFNLLEPSEAMHRAIHALYFDDQLVGTAVAIHPSILVTAGHHFLSTTDSCGSLSVKSHYCTWHKLKGTPQSQYLSKVLYAQKDMHHDVLVIWIDGVVDWTPLRGYQPLEKQRVVTCWVNFNTPHDLIMTSGVVTRSTPKVCHTKGTITVRGSSGGAVIDHTGDYLVGIHIASNDGEKSEHRRKEDGSSGRLSEFMCSRQIIQVFIGMGIDPLEPWSAAEEAKKEAALVADKRKGKGGSRGTAATPTKTAAAIGGKASPSAKDASTKSVVVELLPKASVKLPASDKKKVNHMDMQKITPVVTKSKSGGLSVTKTEANKKKNSSPKKTAHPPPKKLAKKGKK